MKRIQIVLFFLLFVFSCGKPAQGAESSLHEFLEEMIQENSEIQNIHLMVVSDSRNIHWNLILNRDNNRPDEQPLFLASVGKLVTSTLIGILVEEGKLRYEDSICKHLRTDVCSGLHVHKGIDYSEKIQVPQLLDHTSGLPDDFSDSPKSSKEPMFLDQILDSPEKLWESKNIIDWSKNNLEPRNDAMVSVF
jgi:CubicO group peptidase (beta-lactamase class C family)